MGREALLTTPPDPGARWLRAALWPVVRAIARDDPLLPELAAAYRASFDLHLRHRAHLLPLVDALDRSGIATIVLKGAAVAERWYDDPGRRPMSDVDLLVTPAAVTGALAVARACGWLPRDAVPARLRSIDHAMHLEDADGCQLDLHWRPFQEVGPDASERDLWLRSEPFTVSGVASPARVLSPADTLLHVCVHGTRWTRTSGIRWASDGLLVTRGGGIDWDVVLRAARQRHFVVRTRWTLAWLRVALGAPIPRAVIDELARSPATRWERLEHAITSRPPNGAPSTAGILWTRHVRLSGDAGVRALRGFPAFLATVWDLPSARRLPHEVALRMWRNLPGRRRGAADAEEADAEDGEAEPEEAEPEDAGREDTEPT